MAKATRDSDAAGFVMLMSCGYIFKRTGFDGQACEGPYMCQSNACDASQVQRVGDVDLWQAPLAFVGQSSADVLARLDGAEVPYALLVDSDRRPQGWLSERDLRNEVVPPVADSAPTTSARSQPRW